MAIPIGIVASARHSGGGGGWTPASLPNLFAWWDASDTATITDAGGGAVSQWDDKSGNGRNLTQSTSANRPTTGTRTIGGLNGLDFDPTTNPQHLVLASQTLAQPFTYAVVAKFDNADTGGRRMLTSASNVDLRTNTGVWQLSAGANLNGGTDDALDHYFVAIYNDTSSELRIDGVSAASGSGGTNALSSQTVNVGRNTTATTWDGIVGEIVVVSAVVSGTDLTSLESYLSTKWGI